MGKTVSRSAVLALALLATQGCKKKSDDGAGPAGAASNGSPAAAAAGPLAILNGFEGEIGIVFKETKNAAAPETVPIALEVKADKIRADLPESLSSTKQVPKGHVVFSSPDKKLYVVMDEPK